MQVSELPDYVLLDTWKSLVEYGHWELASKICNLISDEHLNETSQLNIAISSLLENVQDDIEFRRSTMVCIADLLSSKKNYSLDSLEWCSYFDSSGNPREDNVDIPHCLIRSWIESKGDYQTLFDYIMMRGDTHGLLLALKVMSETADKKISLQLLFSSHFALTEQTISICLRYAPWTGKQLEIRDLEFVITRCANYKRLHTAIGMVREAFAVYDPLKCTFERDMVWYAATNNVSELKRLMESQPKYLDYYMENSFFNAAVSCGAIEAAIFMFDMSSGYAMTKLMQSIRYACVPVAKHVFEKCKSIEYNAEIHVNMEITPSIASIELLCSLFPMSMILIESNWYRYYDHVVWGKRHAKKMIFGSDPPEHVDHWFQDIFDEIDPFIGMPDLTSLIVSYLPYIGDL